MFKNGRVEIIANDQGNGITPSYVAYRGADTERLIADAAKNQASLNPANTVFDVEETGLRSQNQSNAVYPTSIEKIELRDDKKCTMHTFLKIETKYVKSQDSGQILPIDFIEQNQICSFVHTLLEYNV